MQRQEPDRADTRQPAVNSLHDGTLKRTEPSYWFGTTVLYSGPSRHIGSAQWYSIADPAAIWVRHDVTL